MTPLLTDNPDHPTFAVASSSGMGVGALMIGFGLSVVPAATGVASMGGPPLPPDVRAFCSAVVALEDTLLIDNQDALLAAIALVSATALDGASIGAIDQLKVTVEGGPFESDFVEAHMGLIDVAAGICGHARFPVVTYDYGYEGLEGAELEARTTTFDIDNSTGQEAHELTIYRVSEAGAGLSIREILDLPDWQDYLTRVRSGFAPPGGIGATFGVPLTVGRWAAVCWIAEGSTSGVLDVMMEDAGTPHWMLDDPGQSDEFFVV